VCVCVADRLEKSIAVRQGMTISFVLESKDDNSKRRQKEMSKKQEAEAQRLTKLQKRLQKEVDAEKDKPKLFGAPLVTSTSSPGRPYLPSTTPVSFFTLH
jgi:tRNA pseudouridine-54 N-methylase